ncbi:MAG TPA: hypothetical protein VF979_02935 [Streptosporangiaceae bacterium]
MRADKGTARHVEDERTNFERAEGERASTAELYADLRPLMFSIAYRMLGRVTDAKSPESYVGTH